MYKECDPLCEKQSDSRLDSPLELDYFTQRRILFVKEVDMQLQEMVKKNQRF